MPMPDKEDLIIEKLESLKESLKKPRSRWESVLPLVVGAVFTVVNGIMLANIGFKMDIEKETSKKRIEVYLDISSGADQVYKDCWTLAAPGNGENQAARDSLRASLARFRNLRQKNQLLLTSKVFRLTMDYEAMIKPDSVDQGFCTRLEDLKGKIFNAMRSEFNVEGL